MSEEWVDLAIESKIVCELCSRRFTEEGFYEHLKEHGKEEVLILKKLTMKTLNMTEEQYRRFILHLECESYARARESIKAEST